MRKRVPRWWVYFVRCADYSLYCGVTTDLARRVDEHNYHRCAAKYTRSRRPVVLVWSEKHASHGAALRRERQLKGMMRKLKEELVASPGALKRELQRRDSG